MTVLLKIRPSQPHFCCSGEIKGRIWPLRFKSASETVNAACSKRLYCANTAPSTGAFPLTLSWTLSNASTKRCKFCTLANVLPNSVVDNTAPEPWHRARWAEETSRVHRQPRVQFPLGAASGKQSPGGAGHSRGSPPTRGSPPFPSRRAPAAPPGGAAPAGAPRAGLPAPAAPCRSTSLRAEAPWADAAAHGRWQAAARRASRLGGPGGTAINRGEAATAAVFAGNPSWPLSERRGKAGGTRRRSPAARGRSGERGALTTLLRVRSPASPWLWTAATSCAT